ncbi:MAG: peptidylprolyl isomerase, partial [Bacteroidota bacterium]
MMRSFGLLLLCLLSTSLMAQERQILDKVIGVVGHELILLSDVEDQYSLMQKQNGDLPQDFRCSILDQTLARNLFLNQARLDSIIIGEDELEAQLDARITQILAYMNNDPVQFREYYGASVAEVKEQFRIDLENKLLVERMQNQVISDATVTPSEVKDFFHRIPQDSLPYFNSEVEVAEIVYYPKVNSVEKKKARTKLEEIRQRIVDGEDFGELARRYSDDTGSARSPQGGGDLSWVQRGQFVPEFEATAYNLEKNELSQIVETEFGFHLIELLERRGNSIHTRHILIKPEITDEDLALASSRLDSIRTLVVRDSFPFTFAVKRFSSDKQQSYSNGGNIVNPKSGNTFFEIADLDPDIYFTIDTMEINDVSAPFAFKVGPGETAFRVILLKSRTKPHKANLALDYSKIKTAALESKKNEYINQWVDSKISS